MKKYSTNCAKATLVQQNELLWIFDKRKIFLAAAQLPSNSCIISFEFYFDALKCARALVVSALDVSGEQRAETRYTCIINMMLATVEHKFFATTSLIFTRS